VKPDTVCVELDQMRYEALTDETRWRKLDIFQVIRQKKVLFLMASLALQAYQRRLGEKLGVKPGAELLAGVDAAKRVGAEVVLADRDVQATLRRTWANLGFVNKLKLIGALGASVFDTEEIDEEQIEALKDREHISDMMGEFAKVMPEVKEPLIDERDRYLMSAITDAPGKVVVGVVGAGHVEGMVKQLGKQVDRDALSVVPPPSRWTGLIKWVIPAIILVAFYWGYRQHQGEDLQHMLQAWILPNAIMCGLLTAVAGGKLLSIITGIVSSPITSLNPTIGAGMVVGLVEAWLRKPTVEDAERLGKEVNTFSGMRKNPFSRILLVFVAAQIGSALGAYIGLGWVLSYL
jgi:pheromone shutdown-related protein TraB